MALPVAEVVAVGQAVVAGVRVVVAAARVVGPAQRVAVEVVARPTAAEARVVGLPPAAEEGPVGAEVAAVVDGAAEDAEPIGAARRVAADRVIGRGGPDGEVDRAQGHGGADHCGASEEAPPRHPGAAEGGAGSADQGECGVGGAHVGTCASMEIERRIRFTWWTIDPTRPCEPATM